MARRNTSPQNTESVQLGPSDVARLTANNERLANALRSSPESFAKVFGLRPSELEVFCEDRGAGISNNSPAAGQFQSNGDGAPNARIHNDVALNIEDALRLAMIDERFGSGLFSYPEDLAGAFNLRPSEVAAIRTVSESVTLEEAVAKVRAELNKGDDARSRGASVRLDVRDALNLAAIDERFASALRAFPELFKEAFNLTERDLLSIAGPLGSADKQKS
jgi:hypothetical protein